jgi:hypothetical protein
MLRGVCLGQSTVTRLDTQFPRFYFIYLFIFEMQVSWELHILAYAGYSNPANFPHLHLPLPNDLSDHFIFWEQYFVTISHLSALQFPSFNRMFYFFINLFFLFFINVYIYIVLLFSTNLCIFIFISRYSYCIFMYLHRARWHSSATLTEVFPCFFLSCKANARVKP